MNNLPISELLSAIAENESILTQQPISSTIYANSQYEIIKRYILEFEKSLDSEHEVGLVLTNFGTSITMQVTHISYEESALMVYKGFVDGNPATLIQHISQINFLLTSVPKPSDCPKQPIGFDLNDSM